MFTVAPPAVAPPGTGLRSVPGDPGLPLVGYTHKMLYADPVVFGRERYEQYGPVSWMSALGIRMVTVTGPDASGRVLQNRDKAFSSGPAWGYFIGPFFRRGIMLLDFEEHLHHRRIMQQAFTNERLARYLDAMNPAIATGLDGWRTGGRFLVYPNVKRLTLDLATSVFMGGGLGAEADRINRAFVDCVRAGTAWIRYPVPGLRWSRGLAGRRLLEAFLAERLPAKRAGTGDDLFTALCHAESEDGHRFTDADVVNHMIFLLMAAHDTSTITMTAMAYHLARSPEWQQRCREESLALGGDTVSYDQLARLGSLDLVMKEALRLVSPVPWLPRRAVRDTEILGYFVPEGTTVVVSPYNTHHMPEYWPEPERFAPERFAEHRREDKVHRHAWEPFGGGAHKCIGMYFASVQVKAVMHQLLRRYRWSVDPSYQVRWDMTSLPRPKDNLPVRLEPLF
ncbi:MAG: cytochrome P450 [Micromonosporaceae bacterium]